jgi:hypothetical protein
MSLRRLWFGRISPGTSSTPPTCQIIRSSRSEPSLEIVPSCLLTRPMRTDSGAMLFLYCINVATARARGDSPSQSHHVGHGSDRGGEGTGLRGTCPRWAHVWIQDWMNDLSYVCPSLAMTVRKMRQFLTVWRTRHILIRCTRPRPKPCECVAKSHRDQS